MSSRSAVNACLAALAQGRNVDLSLDAHGMVSLAFDEGHQITLEVPEHGALGYAHAPVMRLHAAEPEATLRKALDLNLFRTGRPGTWLALDAEAATLVLCTSFEARGLAREGLEALLTEISACLARLGEALRGVSRAASHDTLSDHERWADSGQVIIRS